MAHMHADAMRLYAEDAVKYNDPWLKWEAAWDDSTKWYTLDTHPTWGPNTLYRRKQSSNEEIKTAGDLLTKVCHGAAANWWVDIETGDDLRKADNVPEKLMLIVSEVAEAMEGHRKSLMDDKLPHRPMLEVELADAVIRIFDLAGAKDLDVAGAIAEKIAYNASRADHKLENRRADGGKRY